jgi:hypothetical protein
MLEQGLLVSFETTRWEQEERRERHVQAQAALPPTFTALPMTVALVGRLLA